MITLPIRVEAKDLILVSEQTDSTSIESGNFTGSNDSTPTISRTSTPQPSNEEINFIFLSTLEDINLNEIAIQHKFSHVYFPSQLKDLDKINHNIKFDDTISKLDEKYFRSTKENSAKIPSKSS